MKTYLTESRDLFGSLVMVIPLFLLYQIGVLATGGIRNGVDFVTDVMWLAADSSLWNYVLINVGILVAFGIGLFTLRRKGTFNPRIWPWVIGESAVYAMLLGSAVMLLMTTLGLDVLLSTGPKSHGFFTSLVLSLGAGLYEEIVFRLVLMGGLFWAGVKALKLPTWVSAVGAVVLSSLVFSGIHYIGALGDTFALGSFVFRFFAGVLLAVIFYLRGFAVAVYTHAIYDIIVMVFH
jgi:hypothetical protein